MSLTDCEGKKRIMKNQYVGDIGDYGKYGLLRFLAEREIRIGVNWYLTENDNSTDGKFTDYLSKEAFRIYDPILFDTLKSIAFLEDKTVQMVESTEVIPNASYYHALLDFKRKEPLAREWGRRNWFLNSFLFLDDADLIFADPDNGISFQKNSRQKDNEKFVLPEEIVEYYGKGKDIVYYCHKGRRRPEDWEMAKAGIRKYIRDCQILVLTYHRGTQRSYIFVVHPDQYRMYAGLLNRFENTAWGNLFSREKTEGNVLTTDEERNLF